MSVRVFFQKSNKNNSFALNFKIGQIKIERKMKAIWDEYKSHAQNKNTNPHGIFCYLLNLSPPWTQYKNLVYLVAQKYKYVNPYFLVIQLSWEVFSECKYGVKETYMDLTTICWISPPPCFGLHVKVLSSFFSRFELNIKVLAPELE